MEQPPMGYSRKQKIPPSYKESGIGASGVLLHDLIYQVLIAVYHIVDIVIMTDSTKMPAGTSDFCLFDVSQLHRGDIPLGLCDEVDMLHIAFTEGDRPVWIISADGCRNKEAIRELHIDHHAVTRIELFRELLLIIRVIDDIIIKTLSRLEGIQSQTAAALVLEEYIGVVCILKGMVLDMLDHGIRFLLIDDLRSTDDESFRIVTKHQERLLADSLQDSDDILPCKSGLRDKFPDQIILDMFGSCDTNGMCFIMMPPLRAVPARRLSFESICSISPSLTT